MLKKMCFMAIAALIACSATTSFAQIDLTNFDDGTTQGWDSNSGDVIITSTTFDNTIHATTGEYALNVFNSPAVGFQWGMILDNNDYPDLQNWIVSHPMVEADVSWKTSEWSSDPDGAWNRWDAAAINSDAGWMQTNDSLMSDSANPGAPGGWDPFNFGESHQRTISWDFSSLIAGNEAAIQGSSFFQLYLATNFDAAFDTGNGYSFWIDSIRLVPEPTSFALLGLCGVSALLRRRR